MLTSQCKPGQPLKIKNKNLSLLSWSLEARLENVPLAAIADWAKQAESGLGP